MQSEHQQVNVVDPSHPYMAQTWVALFSRHWSIDMESLMMNTMMWFLAV
jgi:hypothetical protein